MPVDSSIAILPHRPSPQKQRVRSVFPIPASSRSIDQARASSPKFFDCKVCGNDRCTLQSHRHHARNAPKDGIRKRKTQPDSVFKQSYALVGAQAQIPAEIITSCIDPFQIFPVDETARPLLDASIVTLAGMLLSYTYPFKTDSDTTKALSKSWIELMTQTDLTCLTTIATWIAMEISRLRHRVPETLTKLSVEYEGRVIQLIRSRLQQEKFASDSVLISSITMITAISLHDPSPARLRNLANGAYSLIQSRGGLMALLDDQKIVSRAIRAEWTASLFNADACLYKGAFPKPMFTTKLRRDCAALPPLGLEFTKHCSDNILEVVADMRLLLWNTSSHDHERICLLEDYRILVSLLQYVDVEHASLQAEYIGTGELVEGIILALILIRLDFIGSSQTQPHLSPLISKRLKDNFTTCDTWTTTNSRPCRIWVCAVGAMTAKTVEAEAYFRELFVTLLTLQYNDKLSSEWPVDWESRTHEALRNNFLWHKRFDIHFGSMCSRMMSELLET